MPGPFQVWAMVGKRRFNARDADDFGHCHCACGGLDVTSARDRRMNAVAPQWTRFAAFESGAYGGGVLRSHPPNLRLDGSEPVSTPTRTDDTDRYSIVLTMRFALP